jgi:hypothetical protein
MQDFINELIATKVPVGVLYQTFLDRYNSEGQFSTGFKLVEVLLNNSASFNANNSKTRNVATTTTNFNSQDASRKLLLCEYFLHRLYEGVEWACNPFWGHILANYVTHAWLRFIYFEHDLGGFTVDMLLEKGAEYDLYGNSISAVACDNDNNTPQSQQHQPPFGENYYDEQYVFRVEVSEIYKVLELNQFYDRSEVFEILRPIEPIEVLERLCCDDITDEVKVLTLADTLEASINKSGGCGNNTASSFSINNNNIADHNSAGEVGHQDFLVKPTTRLATSFVRLLNINRTAKIVANLALFDRVLTAAAAPAWLLDEYLTLLCTRLSPRRITNLTADFVNRLLHATAPTDVDTRKRVVSGVVLRWFESIESEKNEINLICLFLAAIQHYIAETDSIFLYGQLLPYIGRYENAKNLYFSNMNGGLNGNNNNNNNNNPDTRSIIYS